jgi:hypothetical protein
MRSRAIACTLLAAAAFVPGCRHWPLRSRAVPDCPGELVATASLPDDFLLRERVRIASGDEIWSLQLIAQKRGDELLLIGLDPLGVKLFTLRQRGTTTSVEALPPPVLEVPPENLLRDLHRVRFLTLASTTDDGTRRGVLGDLEITEIRKAGRLVTRNIRRVNSGKRADSEILFSPASEANPARATVLNFACGTRSVFDTLVDERIR